MNYRELANGFEVVGHLYKVRYNRETYPKAVTIFCENMRFMRLPVVSTLDKLEEEEALSNWRCKGITEDGDGLVWTWTADSDVWDGRSFRWVFSHEGIAFHHEVKGKGALGRCRFFSVRSEQCPDNQRETPSPLIFVKKMFKPTFAHLDDNTSNVQKSHSLGIGYDLPQGVTRNSGLDACSVFTPTMLCYCFGQRGAWMSVGIGTPPGGLLFNSFEYVGQGFSDAGFYVNYMGYTKSEETTTSPICSMQFGYSQYEALEKHVAWLDAKGFTTPKQENKFDWHRKPIFCGWSEQCGEAQLNHTGASIYAKQECYERYVETLEGRGIPFFTIGIDDKWQTHYGRLEIDTEKWPDLPGFIARQHDKGRRVLLWMSTNTGEGLPDELRVLSAEGNPGPPDITNPEYEKLLRADIKYLVKDVGVDGFKEDWISGPSNAPGARIHGSLFGIEFFRRLQYVVYDETHKWKPDALIETQTPHPMFRESSDVLRLNDIWLGTRDTAELMRERSRVATIAGWNVFDCDDCSQTYLEELLDTLRQHPEIGVPSLYIANQTQATLETIPDEYWTEIRRIWTTYLYENGL